MKGAMNSAANLGAPFGDRRLCPLINLLKFALKFILNFILSKIFARTPDIPGEQLTG